MVVLSAACVFYADAVAVLVINSKRKNRFFMVFLCAGICLNQQTRISAAFSLPSVRIALPFIPFCPIASLFVIIFIKQAYDYPVLLITNTKPLV